MIPNPKITIIGLGYVGLPLALEFAKHYPVTGFDINETRIAELRAGIDRTRVVGAGELQAATSPTFTSDPWADPSNLNVDTHDPRADPEEARREYGLELIAEPEKNTYDAITLAVAHDEFKALVEPGIRNWTTENGVVYDLKNILPNSQVDVRL